MIREMTIEDFVSVSSTLRKHMSLMQLDVAAIQFAQDKEISRYEAKAILLVAYSLLKNDSIKYVLSVKENRIKELTKLGIQV